MCNEIFNPEELLHRSKARYTPQHRRKMATKDAQSTVLLLLLSSMSVLSYLQFVDPGRTEADSSLTHSSQFPSGQYPYWPNRTVDGNFSQTVTACLHTATSGVKEAWLRIDLQTVKSIKSVKFWYRNDRGSEAENTIRLRGYSIRVSKASNVSPGLIDACFTDDMSGTLPTVIQKDCKRTTKYVWFYQPRVRSADDTVPILEICEVQIFGCETGTYDVKCSKTCSHCKNSETCNTDTGQCDYNVCAVPGFKPPLCSECRPGYCGPNCSSNCSMNCHEKACDRYSGEYLYGCTLGYQKPYCFMPCMHGYYGYDCTKTCGNCLNNKTCNNVNGTCTDGCIEGFKGDLCITKCSSYEYGRNCENRCSYQCYNNETCDPFFGYCSRCADGYQNAKCDEQCNHGTYGENCTYLCGECLNVVTCNHVNGKCPEGCKPGWQSTQKCDKPCRNGTFGNDCKFICSGNCEKNDTCDRTNGACINCAPGWESHYCNKTCDVGLYGSNCKETCGHCLKADNCSYTDGTCFGGCLDGFTGDTCYESTQSSHTEPETPGAVVIAAPVVVVVLITVIVAVVILRKRQPSKMNKKKENSVQLQAIPVQDEEDEMPSGDEVYYTNHQIHAKHIKIRELRSVIHSLEHDMEDGFEKEFRAIPYGENPEIPCTVGKLPENMVKNRFKTTFP